MIGATTSLGSELTKEDFEPGFWDDFYAKYDAGGYGHVAAYLAAYDLSGFDAKAAPEKTATFWEIVDTNRAPEESELASLITCLGDPAALTLQDLVHTAMGKGHFSSFYDWLTDRKNRRTIPRRLEPVGYVSV